MPIPGIGEFAVRPGTSDVLVLRDTFIGKFHLPPFEPAVILDLGSHIGTTIAHFAYLYPKARIYGVEMDAENFALCRRNIAPWSERCQILHAAVAASDGESSYDPNIGIHHWGYRIGEGSQPVETQSIDNLFARFELNRVDYLKMDIEGTEADLLQAGGKWTRRVRTLKVETHKPYTPADAIEDLEALGFVCKPDVRHKACVLGERNLRFSV